MKDRRSGPPAALAAAGLLLASTACAAAPVQTTLEQSPTTAAPAGALDTVTWMLPEEPGTLDLDGEGGTAQNTVMANTCERLMRMTPELGAVPHLAEEAGWEGDDAVVLRLNRAATFRDGTPITADDVVWSMERHAAEGASEADEYANVESIDKTGEYEVTVRMAQADAVFLPAMAGNGGIVYDRRVIEADGDAYGTPDGSDACTGPYRLAEWRSGTQVILERDEGYWNPEGAATTDRVVFRWAEQSAVVNMLATGEADGAYLDTAAAAVPLLRDETVQVFQGPSTNVWSLITTERGGLADPRLRRALSLALERDGIARAAFGGLAEPWSTPLGPGGWGYETARFRQAYDAIEGAPASPAGQDLERARALVASAGAPEEPIVVASDGEPARTVIANAVVDAARTIGLEAEIRTVPRQQYGSFYVDADLRSQVDLFADEYWISKNDPVGFYKNGASDAGVNYSGFTDPDYDELVKDAQAATDDAERAELAVELERRWSEAMVWIPVVQVPTTLAMGSHVTGAPASAAFLSGPWAAGLGAREEGER
ncbi:ABC transporter substrate-binding protein [Nocardiopsis aegyptia]|uniref:Peptide/nickel transport system substrate-binding protein n=1 Tax=Nocardiopsis aegyptia TaxID=220378 RepID=A0A7Z0ETI9_9ACTN|nr:ABC transporter substrate-binding protein [Nocardiopsis aegyptia]NYJ38009.1 peptide/nickel transport system substrate-binding protein [Nocardiopsis aegyptia]